MTLLDALGAAKDGSRELDRLVGEAIGGLQALSGDIVGLGYARYTTSIDCALQLVDDNTFVDHLCQMPDGWTCKLSDKIDERLSWEADAATAPLAIAIAALRARAIRDGAEKE